MNEKMTNVEYIYNYIKDDSFTVYTSHLFLNCLTKPKDIKAKIK